MMHLLPALPYSKESLTPYMTSTTLDFHYGKHHQAYVDNLNKLILGTEFENKSLEDIVLSSYQKHTSIFNNAAQVWNHTFFWQCMKPNGGGRPSSHFGSMIDKDFGSFEAFSNEFKQAALTQFGSGWAWLVLDNGTLKIVKTSNAELPMTANQKALLTCDVWEHAYYIDYQNRRMDYVDVFLTHLVNWDFVEENLKAAL